MRTLNEFRLIDLLSHVDISAIESDVPDGDLENPELAAKAGRQEKGKKRLAIFSGIAAGIVIRTWAIMLLHRKHVKCAA